MLLAGTASGSLVIDPYRFVFGPTYATEVLKDAPYAYWRLNEVSPSGEGSLEDSSGNGRNATPNGASFTWQNPGFGTENSPAGRSAGLTAANSNYITAPSGVAAAIMGSSTWTIEFWLLHTGANNQFIMGAAADATHRVAVTITTGKLVVTSSVGGSKMTNYALLQSPHHVVITSAGDLYLDGVAQTGSNSASLSSVVGMAFGARQDPTAYMTGFLSEIAVYNTVLSGSRVLAHYNAGAIQTVSSGLNFQWDTNTLTADLCPPGSDFYGQLDLGATLSAFSTPFGSSALNVAGGTYKAANFYNPYSWNAITSGESGQISVWCYIGASSPDMLIVGCGGKDISARDDSQDGVHVRLSATSATLNYVSGNGATTQSVVVTKTMPVNTWFQIIGKWSKTPVGGVTLWLSADGTVNTASPTLGNWANTGIVHQIIVGNDRNVTPTTAYFTRLQIWGSWQP